MKKYIAISSLVLAATLLMSACGSTDADIPQLSETSLTSDTENTSDTSESGMTDILDEGAMGEENLNGIPLEEDVDATVDAPVDAPADMPSDGAVPSKIPTDAPTALSEQPKQEATTQTSAAQAVTSAETTAAETATTSAATSSVNSVNSKYAGKQITCKVTALSGSTITAETGEISMPGGGMGGQGGNGTPPEMPTGGMGGASDAASGGTPPEMPSGGMGGEGMGEAPSGNMSDSFTSDGGTVEITVTDSIKLTKMSMKRPDDTSADSTDETASIDEIAENTILTVVYDDNGSVIEIIIGGGMGTPPRQKNAE